MVAYSCLCKGAYEDSSRLQPDLIEGERMALVRRMAAERGVTPSAIVLAWLMTVHRTEGFPRIIPLFSARPAHFAANMRALELTLGDEELAEMNNTL
jgi:aryl-alcohol dehydrogenase-like predicted oxidoreductase